MYSRDSATDRRVLGQGHILEALADDGVVLAGTLAHLGQRFELSPDDLRACLRDLVRAGWIAVQTQPFGRVIVRLERRSHAASAEGSPATERRRWQDAWSL